MTSRRQILSIMNPAVLPLNFTFGGGRVFVLFCFERGSTISIECAIVRTSDLEASTACRCLAGALLYIANNADDVSLTDGRHDR